MPNGKGYGLKMCPVGVVVDLQNGQVVPGQVEGKLVTRVSLGMDVMARLQHQMQQVFENVRQAQLNGAKTEKSSS